MENVIFFNKLKVIQTIECKMTEIFLLKLSYPVQLFRLAAVLLPEEVEFSVKIVHPEDAPTSLKKNKFTFNSEFC